MKTAPHTKPASAHTRRNGAAHVDVIENAKRTAREAREMAMEQALSPAMRLLQNAGEHIQEGVHDAMEYADGTWKQVKSQASKHPWQVIGCAVGAGMLAGFWMARR